MSPSRVATWVLTWLVLVTVGSTLVWTVISRAGEQVVASDAPLVATSGLSSPKASPPKTSRPPRTPKASKPSSAPTPASSAPASPAPTSSAPASPAPTSSAPASPAPTSSGPTSERRTSQGPGGLVVAQCDGSVISRVSLLPDNGYKVELKDDGPEKLEVEFEGREDQDGHSSQVSAVCVKGVPVFKRESETGD